MIVNCSDAKTLSVKIRFDKIHFTDSYVWLYSAWLEKKLKIVHAVLNLGV